ncbi:hypothetical protein ACE6H2_016972 [Prunus campanulata]
MYLICTCLHPSSTRPFGSYSGADPELGARAIPGWVTHWEVGQRGGPKRTISCYSGADPGCDS